MHLPESIPEFDYFLKAICTPGWDWFFRVLFVLLFLGVLVSYWYYAGKEKKEEK